MGSVAFLSCSSYGFHLQKASVTQQTKCMKVFSIVQFRPLYPQPNHIVTQSSQNQSEAQLRVLRSSANFYTALYRTPEYTNHMHAKGHTEKEAHYDTIQYSTGLCASVWIEEL